MRPRSALVPSLILSAVAPLGCGWDSLLLTPRGFSPTDPPRVVLAAEAPAGARISVYAADGRRLVTSEAPAAGEALVELPPEAEGRNLVLVAVRGNRAWKALIPEAARGAITGIGAVDAASTALAQLASYEVITEAGSSLPATPSPALRGLITALITRETPELAALRQTIAALLDAGRDDGSFPAFDGAGWALSESYLVESGLGAERLEAYRQALAAAATGYGLEIRCDPSRLNVMFAVDMSGRGRDGNGNPQLIRQPTKEDKVYVGFTTDESSAIDDPSIPRRLAPNDPSYAMSDDGQGGDEVAGDGIYTTVVAMPRGARVQYKYTNGSAGEGFTGTEEWPGNARILLVEDVLTGRPDGQPDCLVVRRDAFGDEASNKNFVNLHAEAKRRGGTLPFDLDLGGVEVVDGADGVKVGGLSVHDPRQRPPLTPAGVAEARENGVCQLCPAPLTLDPDDMTPPSLVAAERLSVRRVRLRFSEPILAEDARDLSKYLYLDDAGRRVEVRQAAPSGSDVLLTVDDTHPTTAARIRVRELRDVSPAGNLLGEAGLPVGPDRTAPKLVSVRAASRLELPGAGPVDDPTIGELIEVVLDEIPEASAASDPARFRIDGLEVRAASLIEGEVPRVRLVTAPQGKRRDYVLRLVGLRDPAGNALEQEAAFTGFALYRARFGVVPGFAYASSDGSERGLPRGEALFLTGTPLTAARALDGRSLSILAAGGARTDVTGWPQFELKPTGEQHLGQAVYGLEVLLPPGSWAWKAAHGVAGEHVRPPPTLEKVYKVLATANDGTGVRVDPATGRAENGLDYGGAALSESGEEPARSSVVFKREAPDEVCEVSNRDVVCPIVVVGTWRDLVVDQGGRTRDYDDGLPALPPHRPGLPDFSPPRLLDARARDSYSVLLSFDEAIAPPAATLEVALARAEDGVGLPVEVVQSTEPRPHQAVVRVRSGRLADGLAYTVRYRGATDPGERRDDRWRTATVLAPTTEVPLRPLTDSEAPAIVSVTATDLNELVIGFDEAVDPASVRDPAAFTIVEAAGPALEVRAAEPTPDRRGVRLSTARQQILAAYRLTVRGVADTADPANVLTSTTVAFVGFGEREPPTVARARAVGPDRVLVRFSEPVDATAAVDSSRYAIEGLSIRSIAFSGDPARRRLAFNAELAPRDREAVLITTSLMTPGAAYRLSVDGVTDLSGNPARASADFTGVSAPPTVSVALEVQVSDAVPIAGRIPSRAISLATLSDAREGLFVLGARAGADQRPAPGRDGPINAQLAGFPPEGAPLDGIEPRLSDDGTGADRVAGDGIFTALLPDVPLGTTLIWKAFAPYSVAYRDRNPGDAGAAFADALPGPSAYADGQEFPGNENAAVVLDEGAVPGVVRLRALFGDEVSYKKFSGGEAFVWLVGDR